MVEISEKWSNGYPRIPLSQEEIKRRSKIRRKRRARKGYPCQGNYLDVNKW